MISNTFKHFKLGLLLGIPVVIIALLLTRLSAGVFALGIVLGWEACQFHSWYSRYKSIKKWIKERLLDSVLDVIAGLTGALLTASLITGLWLLFF